MTFNCSDACINHSPDLLMTSCFIVQILYYTFEWNNVFCLLSQCCNFDSTSTYVKVTWKCVFEANNFIDHILTSIQNWLQTKHVSGNLLTHPKNKCNITDFRYKISRVFEVITLFYLYQRSYKCLMTIRLHYYLRNWKKIVST